MTRGNELARFFNQLDAGSVGFVNLFRDFQNSSQTYPPHNVINVSDDETILELAVAGFKKHEITMEEHRGQLTIRGEKENESNSDYQYRGIAGRSFVKTFHLAEYYEIEQAKLEDGILTVKFIKNIPEAAKPKLIAIE